MNHNSLENYYLTRFTMKEHHGYSLEEFDSMIPFERDLTVDMLNSLVQKRMDAQQQAML